MENRIKFVGHCNDMPAAMLLADVVVSASVKPESFGKTAVEAQAMGTPVIATAHGGSLETVVDQETGWLVSPENESGMAEALKEAIRQWISNSRHCSILDNLFLTVNLFQLRLLVN